MSDEQGSVHYQISITGRQAAAFFFLLLTALGLSFFFGMKTGAAARKADEAPRVERIEAEPRSPEPAKGKDDDLGFAPKPTAVPAAPTAEPTPRPTRAPRPSPTATPGTSAPPKPTPAPVASPARTRTPTPTPVKAASSTAEKTPTPGKKPPAIYVQVFATNNAAKVDELAKRLQTKGFKADVSPVPNRPGFFRVRLGPYPDRAKAEAAAKKVVAAEPSIKKPIIGP